MLNKLWLCHNINKFYHIFGEAIEVIPTHTKLRDLNDTDFLLGVQFDIMKALEAYKYGFSEEEYSTYAWLNKMYEQIATLREAPKHNYKPLLKVTAITLTIATALTFGFCISKNKMESIETPHNKYTAYGRYYTDGTVITNDGNEWGYSTDTVSDQTPYDNMPVCVGFDDNGTPNDITDDIILGLIYDRETAIYDNLETALSDKFELERNYNNIRISILKEVR